MRSRKNKKGEPSSGALQRSRRGKGVRRKPPVLGGGGKSRALVWVCHWDLKNLRRTRLALPGTCVSSESRESEETEGRHDSPSPSFSLTSAPARTYWSWPPQKGGAFILAEEAGWLGQAGRPPGAVRGPLASRHKPLRLCLKVCAPEPRVHICGKRFSSPLPSLLPFLCVASRTPLPGLRRCSKASSFAAAESGAGRQGFPREGRSGAGDPYSCHICAPGQT